MTTVPRVTGSRKRAKGAPESLLDAVEVLEEVRARAHRPPAYPEYKQSANPWVGELPGHWSERKLKFIAEVRNSNVDKKIVEGEERVRLCNYVDVYYNDYITESADFMTASAPQEQIRRFKLQRGDVVITKDSEAWDDIAVPALVDEGFADVVCGYHLALIRPNPELIRGDYLFRVFASHAIRDQFRVRANGVTRFGIPRDGLTRALFPLPPIEEQKTIAAFLRRQTAKIDSLVAGLPVDIQGAGLMARQARLLHEYRSALVTAAVIGRIDVRDVVESSKGA